MQEETNYWNDYIAMIQILTKNLLFVRVFVLKIYKIDH
jgi:hypothetical protein